MRRHQQHVPIHGERRKDEADHTLQEEDLVLLGVVAVIAAMASVGAYAYWTSGGSGSGAASTANPTADVLTVTVNAAAPDLYPGSTSSFTGTVENTAAYSVAIDDLVPDTSLATGSNTDTGIELVSSPGPVCYVDGSGTDYTISDLKINGVAVPLVTPYQLAASGGADSVGISGKINMLETNLNQDDCKNAQLKVYLRAS